jgi:hypothetical protein
MQQTLCWNKLDPVGPAEVLKKLITYNFTNKVAESLNSNHEGSVGGDVAAYRDDLNARQHPLLDHEGVSSGSDCHGTSFCVRQSDFSTGECYSTLSKFKQFSCGLQTIFSAADIQ